MGDSERQMMVRREGQTGWAPFPTRAYDNEAHLQQLLAENPSWIPGVGQDSLTATEFYTSAGPIDICVVGLDGRFTVVECKLATNSEKRRMVLGQVVDYAASIWDDGPDVFLQTWAARSDVVDLYETLEHDALERLRNEILDGRIDLCLAVDAIDTDLRRLIEFLNRSTRADVRVTALQLAYARDSDVEILIPTTFGGELASAKAKELPGESWTQETFLDALTAEDRPLVERIFTLNDEMQDVRGTSGAYWFGSRPGGQVFVSPHRLRYQPFSLWLNSRGRAMVWGTWTNFPTIANHRGFAPIAEALGQDHSKGSRSVAVTALDIGAFWQAACESDLEINLEDPDAGNAARSAQT